MASILRVNTLTDASSNNSTAMSTINQGTAKAWVNFNGSGTIAIRDSYNVGSLTDGGTGNYDINFTNNFSNTNYAHVGSDGNFGMCNTEPQNLSTNEANVFGYNNSHSLVDISGINTTSHGDLA